MRSSYRELLAQLIEPDWLTLPPAAGERCVQFSSYDRGSDAGSSNHERWYANHDRGNYLRVVDRQGGKEFVMVDVDGPGCLARLWSANPEGLLHFDIDGERAWSVDFGKLCSGEVEGVPDALAAMRARGGNLYLPVSFAKHLTVSASAKDLYYLADVVLLPPGKTVEPFSPELLTSEREHLFHTGELLMYGAGMQQQETARKTGRRSVSIPPNAVVSSIQVALRQGREREDFVQQLQRVRLVVTVGKAITVDVPLPDFFGCRDWRDWQSAQLGIEKGTAYCRWPMPMIAGGKVELQVDRQHNQRDLDGVVLELAVELCKPSKEQLDPLLFRANYHQAKAQPTRPFGDHVVLDAKGRGRFVGCSLLVRNPSRIWWGEGDEKFYVDGEAFPSWFGTGTEDYFGYAWCDPTPFAAPLHAQIRCDGPMNFGFTQLHRTHMLDSVPFQESFRFELERWHWVKDANIDYATVAYWYGAGGSASGLPAVPTADERWLPDLAQPKMFVAEHAVEGESLPVLRCTGGTHQIQDLSFFEATFSRDAHRWWIDGKAGDEMVLEVTVAAAGLYEVTLAMTRADDFGQVQIHLGGQKLGKPFDGYAKDVTTSGPFVAGQMQLGAGKHELRFELLGRNQKAKPRMMVGLDYLRLEKQP